VLVDLLAELAAYPLDRARTRLPSAEHAYTAAVISLQLMTSGGQLTFFSTTMIFGTPIDVTLSELALEAFFPADETTALAMHRLANTHTSADGAQSRKTAYAPHN